MYYYLISLVGVIQYLLFLLNLKYIVACDVVFYSLPVHR